MLLKFSRLDVPTRWELTTPKLWPLAYFEIDQALNYIKNICGDMDTADIDFYVKYDGRFEHIVINEAKLKSCQP